MKLSLRACARLGVAALLPLFLGSSREARADEAAAAAEAGEPPPSPPSFTVKLIAPQADDPPVPVQRPFGRAVQVVLSSQFGLGGYSSRYSSSEAHFSGITVAPGIDVFVLDRLSVGADFSFTGTESVGYGVSGALYTTRATQVGAGARVAVDVPLGAHLSWWPRLTVGYQTSHEEEPLPPSAASPSGTGAATGVTNAHGAYFVVYAPLLVHPVAHFFLGFGPVLTRDIGRTASVAVRPVHDQTSLGAYALVGGWLVIRANGRRWALAATAALLCLAIAAPDSAASPGDMSDMRYDVGRDPIPGDPTVAKPVTEPLATPRFGERGQVVLSADLELRIGARWSDGDDPRSSFHFAVSPSFDAFVADDFTLGAFASYGVAKTRSFGPDGSLGDYTSTSGAIGGRIGFNAPLGRWLSWWPRFSLAWSESSNVATIISPASAQTARGGYDYTQSGLYIYLQAPLLVHPAPHWFLGVGPTLYQDLSRAFKDSTLTNNRTTIGFAYAIGGYL